MVLFDEVLTVIHCIPACTDPLPFLGSATRLRRLRYTYIVFDHTQCSTSQALDDQPSGVVAVCKGPPRCGVTVSDLEVKCTLGWAVALAVAPFEPDDAESPMRLCMMVSISSDVAFGSSRTTSAPLTAVCSNNSSSSSRLTAARRLLMTCSNISAQSVRGDAEEAEREGRTFLFQ